MGILKNFILDIAFPRHCLGCNVLMRDNGTSYVCRTCLDKITFNSGFACAFCKSPAIRGKTCPYCARGRFLDRLWVAVPYENPLVEKMIKTMKYRFVRSVAEDISSLMLKYFEKRLAANYNIDPALTMVVPVPLHTRRLNWRGFNQAEIISDKISERLGLAMGIQRLKRIRNHKPQADMPDRQSRIENVKNTFEFLAGNADASSVSGKTILLIDDISTTGSTLNECARVLKGAGAKEVIGFVFARGKLGK